MMKCRCRINDAVLRVCTATYSNILKYHYEKAEMGLDDPKLLSVCMAFDVLGVCHMCMALQSELVLWILDVLSNDLHAGTPNDCICCSC